MDQEAVLFKKDSAADENWLSDLEEGLTRTRFKIASVQGDNVIVINTSFLQINPDMVPPKRIVSKEHLHQHYLDIPVNGIKGFESWLEEYFLLTEALEYQSNPKNE